MKKEDMKSGMFFRNKETGQIGIPYNGYDYGCINRSIEIAMVYKDDDKEPSGSLSWTSAYYEELEPHELKEEDILTNEHMESVCKIKKGEETCSYLIAGSDGFECAKLSDTGIANQIDDRREEDTMTAKGDNCGGRFGKI